MFGWNRHDLSGTDSSDPSDRLEEQLALQHERYLFAGMAVTLKPARLKPIAYHNS